MYKYFFVTLLAISFYACQKEDFVKKIDMPVIAPKPTINCLIGEGNIIELTLSWSAGVPNNILDEFEVITNATVCFYENNVLIDTLDFNVNNKYSIDYAIQPGNTYSIKANVPGYGVLSASDYYPAPAENFTASIVDSFFHTGINVFFPVIRLSFDDDINDNNYYSVSFNRMAFDTVTMSYYYTHSICASSTSPLLSSYPYSDEFGSEMCYKEFQIDDYDYNGQSIIIDFKIWSSSSSPNDSFYINLGSTTEVYQLYSTTYSTYMQAAGNPFAEPVQVYGNIENGYGIFAIFKKQSMAIPF